MEWVSVLINEFLFDQCCVGYFIGILFPKESAPIVGTFSTLFWALLLSGVQPDLEDVLAPGSSYSYFSFLWSMSASRWAVEVFWIDESSSRP